MLCSELKFSSIMISMNANTKVESLRLKWISFTYNFFFNYRYTQIMDKRHSCANIKFYAAYGFIMFVWQKIQETDSKLLVIYCGTSTDHSCHAFCTAHFSVLPFPTTLQPPTFIILNLLLCHPHSLKGSTL